MKNIQSRLRIYYVTVLAVTTFIFALLAGYFCYRYFELKDFMFLFLSVISLLSIAISYFLLYPIQALREAVLKLDRLDTLMKENQPQSNFSETVGKALQEYIEPHSDLYEEREIKFEEPDEALDSGVSDTNDDAVDYKSDTVEDLIMNRVSEDLEKSKFVTAVEESAKDLQNTIEKSIESFNAINSVEIKPFNHNQKLREVIGSYLLANNVPEKYIKDLVDNIYELKFYKDKISVSTNFAGRNSTFSVNCNLNDLKIVDKDSIVEAVDGFENIKSVSASNRMFD